MTAVYSFQTQSWKGRITCLLLTFAALGFVSPAIPQKASAALIFYVDPSKGNDQASGSLDQPFRSISRARDAVRSVNSSMTSDIYVYLRGGEYPLSETLTFGKTDSGNNGFSVIYQAYKDEKPIITGGKPVREWKQVSGKNYFVADVPSGAYPSYFRNIWIDGKRATQAQSGFITAHAMNYDDPSTPQVRDGFIVKAADLKSYSNLNNIRIFQCGVFKHVELPVNNIVSLTNEEKAIVMKQPAFFDWSNNYVFDSPNTLRVFNAFEELDEPGEFYLDRGTRKIYYYPRSNENLNTANVIVPNIETLVKIQGTATGIASNLQFEGISFRYGNWTTPSFKEIGRSQADLYSDYSAIEGQLQLQYTDKIVFKKCRFEHFPNTAIYLPDNNRNTLIEGNVFYDLSAAAVIIGKDMTPRATVNVNTMIRNNVIRSIGADFFQASGIYANTSKDLSILNNDVADVAYFGINQRYSDVSTNFVGNTQIRFNRVTNYCTASRYGFGIGDEVAGFYFFGVQNSTVSDNYAQYAGNKTIAGAFRQDQYGLNNTWTNNVADCKTAARSFSWHNLANVNVRFINNFANIKGDFPTTTSATNTNFKIETSWSPAAQAIMDAAGLEPQYRYLLDEFGKDEYDLTAVPKVADLDWSKALWEYLLGKRVPFVQSLAYWRTRWGNNQMLAMQDGAVKITNPTFGSAVIFRGAFYGNETIRFNARFSETGTGKQIIAFRAENCTEQHMEQANYQLLFTPTSIELQRYNHDRSKVVLLGNGGVLGATKSYESKLYSSEELIEITTLNQSDGVRIVLKIGGLTQIDVVDKTAGYLTKPGFLIFNSGKLTGSMFIRDAAVATSTSNPSEVKGTLYPNPNRGYEFSVKNKEPITNVLLLAADGRQLAVEFTRKNNQEFSIKPQLPLRGGTYILSVQTSKGIHSYQVIVQ